MVQLLLIPTVSGLAGLGGVVLSGMLFSLVAASAARVSQPTQLPSLNLIFNLATNPAGIIFAGVFGFSPALLVSRIDNLVAQYQSAINGTEMYSREVGGDRVSSAPPSVTPEAPKRVTRSTVLGLTLPIWGLIVVIVLLVAVSILLFRSDFIVDLDARLLTLFAVAGALGGAPRSLAYGLASGSFTQRERRQWLTEALVGPVTGAVAGLLAYLVVRASLVASPRYIVREGQYVISLLAGALALRPLASVVERGLLRSSMSRSGILGGEISPSVPLLDRIEKVLEQRVAASTLSNYDGWIDVTPRAIGPLQWALDVTLRSSGGESARGLDEPRMQSGRIVVVGGDDRDAVLFTVSVVSKTYVPSPPLLSISTPRDGRSEITTIFLDAVEGVGAGPALSIQPESAVILEVGQGTNILMVLRVLLHP